MTVSPVPQPDRPAGPRSGRRAVGRGLILATALLTVLTGAAAASANPPATTTAAQPNLGPNVIVFDPSMPIAEIQATVDAIYASRSTTRWAPPGTRCCSSPAPTAPPPRRCSSRSATTPRSPASARRRPTWSSTARSRSTTGAWRTAVPATAWRWSTSGARCPTSPSTSTAVGQDGCRASANFWAVSQAVSDAPGRSSTGPTCPLMDYCTAGPQYASGGFIADSKAGTVVNGSQQQCLIRNSDDRQLDQRRLEPVFAGVTGAPSRRRRSPSPPYTTLATTPVSREKPYLFVDDAGKYNVFVPSAQTDSSGHHLGRRPDARAGPSRCPSFFVAKPADSVGDDQLAARPGQEPAAHPGRLRRRPEHRRQAARTRSCSASAMATLTAVNGAVPMTVADVPGVDHRRAHDRRRHGQLAGAAAASAPGRTAANALQRPAQPDHPAATCTSASAARTSARPTVDPRGQQRQRADRQHLGLAGRPRRARLVRLGRQHRRNGVIVNGDNVTATGPLRRALPAVQRHLERRERPDRLLPERAAVRPAEPGRLAARRHPRLGRPTRWPTRSRRTSCGAAVATSSPTSTRPSTPRGLRGAGHAGREAAPRHDGQPAAPARSTTSSTTPARRSTTATPATPSFVAEFPPAS